MTKHNIQKITDEISQRLAILQREGWDTTEAMDNIRDINLALVIEEAA